MTVIICNILRYQEILVTNLRTRSIHTFGENKVH